MYYEINVTLNGKHLFATAERSATCQSSLKLLYDIFKEKFPESEGYEISVTRWERVGYHVDMNKA